MEIATHYNSQPRGKRELCDVGQPIMAAAAFQPDLRETRIEYPVTGG